MILDEHIGNWGQIFPEKVIESCLIRKCGWINTDDVTRTIGDPENNPATTIVRKGRYGLEAASTSVLVACLFKLKVTSLSGVNFQSTVCFEVEPDYFLNGLRRHVYALQSRSIFS